MPNTSDSLWGMGLDGVCVPGGGDHRVWAPDRNTTKGPFVMRRLQTQEHPEEANGSLDRPDTSLDKPGQVELDNRPASLDNGDCPS
jgi:hypothetical protein